jgi:hypothetical protein
MPFDFIHHAPWAEKEVFMNIKVVVLNTAGGVGKSTFAKHCLSALIPNSVSIAIEDWNSGAGKVDLEMGAKSFYKLATQLNIDDEQSFVIDIGTSNSKPMLQHFADLSITCAQIDFWVVAVRAGAKERIDTLKTISKLMEINVDASKIVVIAQAVTDIEQFDLEFKPLVDAAREFGFIFAKQAVLFNPVFDMIKGTDRSVFEIVETKLDLKKLRFECHGDEQKLVQLGHDVLVYCLAETACRNLLAVFQSTPIYEAVMRQPEVIEAA